MKERALALASRLEAVGRNKDMGRPPINDTEREAAALIRYLQSRLESMEKDAARLDWMEQVGRVSIERVREGRAKGPLRWDVEYGRYDNIAESKKSMRDAIDEAMKG